MMERFELYLSSLQPIRDPTLLRIKEVARKHRIPIMEDVSMEIVLSLIKLKKPKKILEIGSAIGYSAIRMAKAEEQSLIISYDMNEERLSIATAFSNECGLSDRISFIHGDALAHVSEINDYGPYDFMLIDAAKGQYKRYFETFAPMVTQHGVIVTDNVFFRGMVPGIEPTLKKYSTVVKRLREYNEYLANHDQFETTFYPVGDGLAVSIKM